MYSNASYIQYLQSGQISMSAKGRDVVAHHFSNLNFSGANPAFP